MEKNEEIKEYYVSYETAKIAKEHGFDEKTEKYYDSEKHILTDVPSDFPELTYKNSPIEIELSTFKYNMSSPSEENFLNKIKECSKQNYIINPNIFLSDHDFVNIIIEHFLGKNWYVCSPISNVQVNAEAMLEILDKYPNINGNRIGKTFFLKRYFRKLWNSLKKNYKK